MKSLRGRGKASYGQRTAANWIARSALLHGLKHAISSRRRLRSLRSLYACSGLEDFGAPRGVPRTSTEGRTEPASGSASKGGHCRPQRALALLHRDVFDQSVEIVRSSVPQGPKLGGDFRRRQYRFLRSAFQKVSSPCEQLPDVPNCICLTFGLVLPCHSLLLELIRPRGTPRSCAEVAT